LNIKKLTALALVALATVALSGCSLSRYVASLDPYSPSDGTQLDIETFKARNVLLIQGTSGNAILIGSFVNSGQSDISASIQTTDSNGEPVRISFEVPAGTKFDLGYSGNEGVVMPLNAVVGSMHPIFVAGSSDPQQLLVPVMDGSLLEYREFAEKLN